MKFKIKKQVEKRNDLIGCKAKAIFTMLNMGVDNGKSGWWVEEEKKGTVIYADVEKVVLSTDKGVRMCFCMNDVVFI